MLKPEIGPTIDLAKTRSQQSPTMHHFSSFPIFSYQALSAWTYIRNYLIVINERLKIFLLCNYNN